MPWNQTEELCRSTLRAAIEPGADDDAWSAPTPKYEAVDLGEAGKQEIWETHTTRIEKLIAKHGGKQFPARYKEDQEVGVLIALFGSSALRDRFWGSSMSLAIIQISSDWRRNPAEGSAQFFDRLTMPSATLSPHLLYLKIRDAGVHGWHRHRLCKGSERTSAMTSLCGSRYGI
jgi:hypothetical protein